MIKVTEHQHQVCLFSWASWNLHIYPELWFLFAIPNGEYRLKAVASKLRAEGVKAGVSDVFLSVARRGFHGLYIELKTEGGRVSPKQAQWVSRVREQGYYAAICYGFDEAKDLLVWYLDQDEG